MPAAEVARQAAGGVAPVVLGYCMGGLLGAGAWPRSGRSCCGAGAARDPVALPCRAQREQARLLGVLAEPIAKSYAPLGEVPVDVLQALFAAQDPLLVLRKFSRFAELTQDSAAALGFVALEDWLNDGVPLSLPVARECLGGWYGEDRPGRGRWRVGGKPIRPRDIEFPPWSSCRRRIASCRPPRRRRGRGIAAAERLTPTLGHIGMIVARDAPTAVWEPLGRMAGARSRARSSANAAWFSKRGPRAI